MTKALPRPPQKSSREGGQRRLPSEARQPQSRLPLLPVSLLADPTHTHRGLGLGGTWVSLLPSSDQTPAYGGFFPFPSSKQPQCRPKLHSHRNWRQRLLLGVGLWRTQNNRLAVMDGGGREGDALCFRIAIGEEGEAYHLLPNLKVTGNAYFHFNLECYYSRVASGVA